ncbi:hypothetical protein HDU88_000449 [Geranomyces variabilis]|nr:hypothetical protein HDU88_000449 [Geranomyces variabilis]
MQTSVGGTDGTAEELVSDDRPATGNPPRLSSADAEEIRTFMKHLQLDPCPRDSPRGNSRPTKHGGKSIANPRDPLFDPVDLDYVKKVVPVATALRYFHEGRIVGTTNKTHFGDSGLQTLFVGATTSSELGVPSIYGTVEASTTLKESFARYSQVTGNPLSTTPTLLLHSMHAYEQERSYTVIVTYRHLDHVFEGCVPVPNIVSGQERSIVEFDPTRCALKLQPPKSAAFVRSDRSLARDYMFLNLAFDLSPPTVDAGA